jgi:Flp pilus assembly protein TadB
VRTWLSKSVYEALPYFYMGVGVLMLAAATYLDYWHWRSICLVLGVVLLLAGGLVWWRRQEYRRREK